MRKHLRSSAIAIALGFVAMTATAGEIVGPGIISTGLQETSVAMTADGKTLYFMRSDVAEKDDTILVSHRNGTAWSTPEVASFSGQWHDSEPTLSPDGKRLYFVSNRPTTPGGEPLTVDFAGHRFPGTNLWYVERQANGAWGEPVHVDGAMNDGSQIYNPSIAANGNLYFSSHRPDSEAFYQIYVARRTSSGYAVPERIDLGDAKKNRMDPAIDPGERFLVYAGDEGDSLGRADLYVSFRESDGRWGKPVHLPGDVNSDSLENAPSLGRTFGELYLSSNRSDAPRYPKARDDFASLQRRLNSPSNGSRDLWRFDISQTLKSHGIDH